MRIETQETKDENVLNFFPPVQMLKSGSVEVKDSKSIRKSPLAESIFDIGDITSLLITPDMISVTKTTNAHWDDLKPQILAEIMDALSQGTEMVIDNKTDDEEVIKKIQGLINARIRGAIQQDGGDIIFRKFDNGTVYVELTGNCSGCPYATITLKEGVERILKSYIPEVKAVENYVDEV